MAQASPITTNPLEGDELYPLIVLYTLSQGYLTSPVTTLSATTTTSSTSYQDLSSTTSISTPTLITSSSTKSDTNHLKNDTSSTSTTATPTASVDETVEDPKTHEKLLQWLNSYQHTNQISFQTLTHAPTLTSQDSAIVRGVSLDSGAKAMLLRSGKPIKIDPSLVSLSSTVIPSINNTPSFTATSIPSLVHRTPFVLIILAASKQADLSKVKKLLGTKDLRMASVDEVKAITGCIPGAVPPFGSLWSQFVSSSSSSSVPIDDTKEPVITIVDKSILNQGPTINFNAGLRTFSVVNLSVNDYLSIENPLIGDFTK